MNPKFLFAGIATNVAFRTKSSGAFVPATVEEFRAFIRLSSRRGAAVYYDADERRPCEIAECHGGAH